MTLLTDDQRNQIIDYIATFKSKIADYMTIKSTLAGVVEETQMKRHDLSEVTREEQQIETAMDVLYRQTKTQSKTSEIEAEISKLEKEYAICLNAINERKSELTELMRNLPIPVDLGNPNHTNSETIFHYFEDTELGNDVIDTILDLFRQKPPLAFNDVEILPDKVVILNTIEKQEAIQRLVQAIRSFRMRADNLSKSYEKIDELVERLTRSEIYPNILSVLAKGGKFSAQIIADILDTDERKVYDSCYNLTRSNWSPNPIKRTQSGDWELTLAGDILVNRMFEKHPERIRDLGEGR